MEKLVNKLTVILTILILIIVVVVFTFLIYQKDKGGIMKSLDEIFHTHKEIENLKKRIDRLEKQSPDVSDVVQNGYKRHAIICGIDTKRQNRLQKHKLRLREFETLLAQQLEEAEEYIENIQFSEIRQIYRYRYLDNMNWVQIAHEMNDLYKSKIYSDGSVRLKHDRYFQKNFKKF